MDESGQQMLFEAVREAAELAVFSFLCVLDGVSAIENGPEKGELRLLYTSGTESTLLNDSNEELMHDFYNGLCQSTNPIPPDRESTRLYEAGSAKYLRSVQTSGDGIDLHSVPTNGPLSEDRGAGPQ